MGGYGGPDQQYGYPTTGPWASSCAPCPPLPPAAAALYGSFNPADLYLHGQV
jgi:hypothetical protein